MAISLENLRIGRLIVHEAPIVKADGTQPKAQRSKDVLHLAPKPQEAIVARIVKALGSGSHSIRLDVNDHAVGSPFHLMTGLLDANLPHFIADSAKLADKLVRVQVGQNIRPGIAVLIDGTYDNASKTHRFSAIVKAESETGFTKKFFNGIVNLEFIDELLLGAGQKLFKIAFFGERCSGGSTPQAPRDPNDFQIAVYDHNLSVQGSTNAAKYFYSTFLGCDQARDAAHQTRTFFDAASSFLEDPLFRLKPQQRFQLKGHLISYFQSNEPQLSAQIFADRYLIENLRPLFVRRLTQAGVGTSAISKDLSDVARRLVQRKVWFDSDVGTIKIQYPDSAKDNVKIQQKGADGWTPVLIKGHMSEPT